LSSFFLRPPALSVSLVSIATATTEIYTLSLHDALPISEKLIDYSAHFPIVELDSSFYAVQPERNIRKWINETPEGFQFVVKAYRSEEHTSELQSRENLVCRLLLEKKKETNGPNTCNMRE